jgi:hypothetical protein
MSSRSPTASQPESESAAVEVMLVWFAGNAKIAELLPSRWHTPPTGDSS